MFVGIDLGTTFSAISYVNSKGVAEIIPSLKGNKVIPSVVMCEDGNITVGEEAKENSISSPYSVCQFIKRQMGTRDYSFYVSEEESYTPEEVSAIILRNLIINAEKVSREKIEGAVITVPAYFTDSQRNATKDAGEIAGINVIGIINEPTAAALAYCHNNATEDENVLVYDLGGGTFDITILRISDNLKKIDVLATDGMNNLGGFDFDNAIMNSCIEYFKTNYDFDIEEDDELMQVLRIKAENAKIQLSNRLDTTIEIENNGETYSYTISRDEFNSLIESLLSLTKVSMEVALNESNLHWTDISKVLLVGGSTKIPAVRELIKRVTGIEPSTELNPDEAVSLGAAYYADNVSKGSVGDFDKDKTVSFVDVLSHSIGLVQYHNDERKVTIVLNRNSHLPSYNKVGSCTRFENQKYFDLEIYQGEDRNPDYDIFLGNSIVNYAPKPKGYCFEVGISCDVNGIIKVELLDNNKKIGEFTIDRVNNLTRKEIQIKRKSLNDKKINNLERENIKKNEVVEKKPKSTEDKLNSLIGLYSVKNELNRMKSKLEYDRERNRRLGIQTNSGIGHHFVFYGNPGTGKTTVARLVGEILHSYGLLKRPNVIEVSRKDLVGEYIGQTAVKTKEIIEAAMGGILFVDEAYTLYRKDSERDFGREAIEEIMKAMEDKRDKFIVILAGYNKEMKELLEANPGIESRITDYIEFPDYSSSELLDIAKGIAKDNYYTISEDGEKAFLHLINKERMDEKFGNARSVRRIMEKAFETKALLYNNDASEINRMDVLSSRDFGVDINAEASKSAKVYLDELDKMIGLSNVKKEVKGLVAKTNYINEEIKSGRMKEGSFTQNLNLCFTGNPGTGKTTVARIYANILKASSVLKRGHMIEASRNDLVAGYSGQTAIKTRELCSKAYGGILFIDEAYSLVRNSNDSFGQEALDTLIKEMEDNRDKLVVILAGYTKEMNEFMNANSGLKSRIPKFIDFPDYNIDELIEIFLILCEKNQCILADESKEALRNSITTLYESRDNKFGNARSIRNLYENVWQRLAVRVMENQLEGDERYTIIPEDFCE